MAEDNADWLRKQVKGNKFVELHAHLMGMGDADFWLNIMQNEIPKWKGKKQIECYREANNGILPTHSKIVSRHPISFQFETKNELLKYPMLCSEELVDYLRSGEILFTFDVVYDLNSLALAFKTPNATWFNIAENLRAQVNNHDYVLFNARIQKYDVVNGITNDDLMNIIKNDPEKVEVLKSWFTFNPGENFLQVFDPNFSPAKFAMKDCIYKQYLQTIDLLLAKINSLCTASDVKYLELSVGYSDLAVNVAVFKHLYEAKSKFANCEIYYLMAFNRKDSPQLANAMATVDYISNWLTELASPYDKEKDSFTRKIKLVSKFDPLCKQNLFEIVVGLDYMGREIGYPFCPFSIDCFIDFVSEVRTEFNANFGFRFHCKEFGIYSSKPSITEYRHLEIAAAVILKILSRVAWHDFPPPLRIGHEHNGTPIIKKMLSLVREKQIPFEINWTSNYVLVQNDQKLAAERITLLLDEGYSVILCTDDDGVWDCTFNSFKFVSSEYMKALHFGAIRNLHEAKTILRRAPRYSFGPPIKPGKNNEVNYVESFVPTSTSIPVGCVLPFAGKNNPTGFLNCAEYYNLFSVIGYIHGGERDKFCVPDYTGRFLRGNDEKDKDRMEMDTGGNSVGIGSVQSWATGLSKSSPLIATGTTSFSGVHRHLFGTHWAHGAGDNNDGKAVIAYDLNTNNWRVTSELLAESTGSHDHSVKFNISGGDSETRPNNASVNYIIKF